MTNDDQWKKVGEHLLKGNKISEIEINGKNYKLNGTQADYICNLESDFCLNNGGYGSGKSLALYIKLYLFVKCFPGNRILLGRKTLADIERVVLPDLFDIIPHGEYKHRVKDAVINFENGSQIILFGLDALQAGDLGDIKKAQQKIKSLNLGAYFIDQLEEVEYDVFDALNSRLRLTKVPVRQGNMTCNPANFWAYHYFVKGCVKSGDTWIEKDNKSKLYTSSMLDNKDNLPEDYIRRQMEGHDQSWIDRYVYGLWTPESMTERAVFSGFLHKWRAKPPIAVEDGCQIFEQPLPGEVYRMGVDPSEGVIDPSSISVISGNGRKVAKWNGMIPIHALAEKVKYLYTKYKKPLIIPEANAAGAALIEKIRELRVYKRRQFEYKDKHEIEVLGFKTSYQSKQALISHFQGLMKKGYPVIYDQKTIDEFTTFVWTDSAKQQGAGAQRGFHDDDVMSTLLAYWETTPTKVDLIQANITRPKRIKRFQYK